MGTSISSIIASTGWPFEVIRDAFSILGMHLDVDWLKSGEDVLTADLGTPEEYCVEKILECLIQNGSFFLQQIQVLSPTSEEWVNHLYSLENENEVFTRQMTTLRRSVVKILWSAVSQPFQGVGQFYFWLDRIVDLLEARGASIHSPLLEENSYSLVSQEERKLIENLRNYMSQIELTQFLMGEREESILCLCQHLYAVHDFTNASNYLVGGMEAGVNDPLIYYNYFVIASTLGDYEVAHQGYQFAIEANPALSSFPTERYKITSIQERNRFYITFLAQDNESQLPVVIKVLLHPSENVQQKIHKGLEFKHQGVPAFYDWYESNPLRPAFVVQALEGPNAEILLSDGYLSPTQWLQMSLQIVGTMACAHDQGVVHGALHPCKIFLHEGEIKIVDFGMDFLESWALPIARQDLASLAFTAPELLQSNAPSNFSSDVYSLGMLLYYLFTGQVGGMIGEQKIPVGILPILQKATHLDPEQRYKNASEMMMDIASIDEHAFEEVAPAPMPVEPKPAPSIVSVVPPKVERSIPLSTGSIPLPDNMTWQEGLVYSPIDDSQMVVIPAGFFTMGSEERPTESPVHEIYLDTYLIDKYPVTNAQYTRFLEYIQKTGDHSKCHADEPPGKDHTPKDWQNPKYKKYSEFDDCPVILIDWWDAWAYAAWAGKALPSEAQWEKAARGTDARKYPWGSQEANKDLANYNNNFGCTTRVKNFPQGASAFGCMDMAGNVWEWCIDTYDKDFYRESPTENPACLRNKPARSLRGGSWNDGQASLRTSARGCWINMVRYAYIGFRCVRLIS